MEWNYLHFYIQYFLSKLVTLLIFRMLSYFRSLKSFSLKGKERRKNSRLLHICHVCLYISGVRSSSECHVFHFLVQWFIKSLCMSQRLLVLQKILNFFSYYYYYYSYSSSSSRQNLVRTSPPTVLMLQICHLAHIFI